MIERNIHDYSNRIDRSAYVYKGVLFSPKPKGNVTLYVFIDANSLTLTKSFTIGVFSFGLKIFRCRSPPSISL